MNSPPGSATKSRVRLAPNSTTYPSWLSRTFSCAFGSIANGAVFGPPGPTAGGGPGPGVTEGEGTDTGGGVNETSGGKVGIGNGKALGADGFGNTTRGYT